MKFIYEIKNIPWVNSTVDTWPEGAPEQKKRLVVLNFRLPNGKDEEKLKIIIKSKFSVDEVELEEYTV